MNPFAERIAMAALIHKHRLCAQPNATMVRAPGRPQYRQMFRFPASGPLIALDLGFFRFLTRFALSRAIFWSTFVLSTLARPFANLSNARHPLGFFAAMLDRLRVSGVKNVAVTGGRYLIDATHTQAADAAPRRLAVQLNEIQLPAPQFKRLDRIYRYKLPAKLALNNFGFHLLNPHKARVLDW